MPKAQAGDALAQNELGLHYATMRDYSEAARWFRAAAEQGDAYAQTELGRCYLEGRGVARDREKAAEWYGRAAAAGYEPAVEALRELAQ